MRVMYVASEATPFIKSGGLADVIGSLPKETAKKDVESIVVIPKYQDMKFVDQIEYVTNFDIYMGWRKRYCGIFKAEVDGEFAEYVTSVFVFSTAFRTSSE